MTEQHYEQDLAAIRKLMERSAKFISLSGLSGILAGVYALCGAAAAYYIAQHPNSPMRINHIQYQQVTVIYQLAGIAIAVLVASVATGLFLSARKAHKQNMDLWDETSKSLVVNLLIPLISGGIFIIILVIQGSYDLLAPACLLFYGLALINASPKLYDEVRYLGYSEIVLGLICTALPGYSLLLWAIGFGVFHIFYGALMYRKYDQ